MRGHDAYFYVEMGRKYTTQNGETAVRRIANSRFGGVCWSIQRRSRLLNMAVIEGSARTITTAQATISRISITETAIISKDKTCWIKENKKLFGTAV
jgi:hypothetical protein